MELKVVLSASRSRVNLGASYSPPMANESHFATQANVKQLVPVGEFFTPWAGIVEAAEPDSGSHRNRGSVNNNSRVPNCERIKRILDRHADAERTTRPYGRKWRTVNT